MKDDLFTYLCIYSFTSGRHYEIGWENIVSALKNPSMLKRLM